MNYIFDLDGTLVDTVDLHAETFIQAFKEDGKEITKKEVKALMGYTSRDIVRKLGANNPDNVQQRKRQLFVERADKVKEIEGATQVIETLKAQGHTVCIATSCSKKTVEAIMNKFKWPVDMIVAAEDVERGKPAPDVLLKVLERFQGKAVFIGDSLYDKQAAEAAGIPFLLLGTDFKQLKDVLEMVL